MIQQIVINDLIYDNSFEYWKTHKPDLSYQNWLKVEYQITIGNNASDYLKGITPFYNSKVLSGDEKDITLFLLRFS